MGLDLYIQSLKKGRRPFQEDVIAALFSAFQKIGYIHPGTSSMFSDRILQNSKSQTEFKAGRFCFMVDALKCSSKYNLDFLEVDVATRVSDSHARFGYNYSQQILRELRNPTNNPLPLIFHLGISLCALEVAEALQHDEVSVYYDDETDSRSIPPRRGEDSQVRPLLEICNNTTISFGTLSRMPAPEVGNLIRSIAVDLEQGMEYKDTYELREQVSGKDPYVQHITEPVLSLGRWGYGFHCDTEELLQTLKTADELPRLVVISYVYRKLEREYRTEQLERDLNLVFFIEQSPSESEYQVELHLVSQAILPELIERTIDDLDSYEDMRLASWQQSIAGNFGNHRLNLR